MRNFVRLTLQAVFYGALAVPLGYFATQPNYRYADPGMAVIKASVSHAADRVKPCTRLTPEQIAELAANMRQTEVCERERVPLKFELIVDDETLVSVTAEPSGLWNDGPASVYEHRTVSPGTRVVTVRLRDSARTSGWDYDRTGTVELEPGRYFTITFRAESGGFEFR